MEKIFIKQNFLLKKLINIYSSPPSYIPYCGIHQYYIIQSLIPLCGYPNNYVDALTIMWMP